MKSKILLIVVFMALFVTVPSLMAQKKIIISTFDVSTAVVEAHLLLEKAYKKLGFDMELIRFPARRALAEANIGTYTDGELIRIAGLTKEYPNLIQIPVMIANFRISVFSKKIDFAVNGWSSLKPYEIAFMRGFKGMEKHADGLKVYRVSSQEAAMEMLDKDRTELIVLPHLDGLILREKLKMSQIKILSPPLEQVQLYHYLHKKNKELAPEITRVLRKMENDGDIDRFWKKIEDSLL